MLHVDLSVSPGAEVVVAVAGEVGPAAVRLLTESLRRAHRLVAEPSAIVVDLTGARLLTAAGVTALLAFGQECRRRGVPLRLVTSSVGRHDAGTAPEGGLAGGVVGQALAVLMTDLGLDQERARTRLADLARRSGLDVVDVSAEIVSRLPARPTTANPRAGPSGARAEPRALEIDFVAASWEVESAEYRTHIADLAAALSRSGHAVTLHVRRDSPDLPVVARTRRGYRLSRVPAGPPVPLAREALPSCLDEFASYLDRQWDDHAPDVVHLHSWLSGLAVHECRAPLVQSFHGLKVVERHGLHAVERESGQGGGRANLELLMALAADHVIAASGDERRGLVRNRVPATKVSLVPWGVDTDRFGPDGPVARRGTLRRAIALGDLLPHNGFHTVVEAVAGVPDVELLFVGPFRSPTPHGVPELRRLVRHARRHRVADRTRFLGRVERDDLPALLRSCDVAVHVPRHEPSGVAALRAMACGVPVIASAVDALADIVVDGLTGSLVPPGAPVTLGRALRHLLDDPTRREFYSATGVDRVRDRYSWDRVTAAVVDTYRLAVGTTGRQDRRGRERR
ncbi:glycosyltransferase [Umezawaea endophytica]|uniref:Glycosyltransferase n=1 Tax=Umezawaea endophytica TaxID=1654476 RepID=A0A9X2VMI7_9PSEU|nr:glycosyltransferase [Umezawaea endophytica]MCS7477938.1 glycosyltransferase [Umezawaea endophytica]